MYGHRIFIEMNTKGKNRFMEIVLRRTIAYAIHLNYRHVDARID